MVLIWAIKGKTSLNKSLKSLSIKGYTEGKDTHPDTKTNIATLEKLFQKNFTQGKYFNTHIKLVNIYLKKSHFSISKCFI